MASVEQALDSWRQAVTSAPSQVQIVRALLGGQTNRSYLIEADAQRWVLRLGAAKTAAFGIDRQTENIIVRAAAVADLSPPVAHCDPKIGVLITQYIDGTPLTDKPSASTRAHLFDLVGRIHTLDVALPETDYYAHAETYWELLIAAETAIPAKLISQRETIARARRDLELDSSPRGICHRDLNPSNIISCNEEFYILDWEYATFGACAFDYACLAVEFNIEPSRLATHSKLPSNELQHAVDLYRYTCELWRLVEQL